MHSTGSDAEDQRRSWLQLLGRNLLGKHAVVIESGQIISVVCFADADEEEILRLIHNCGFEVVEYPESNLTVSGNRATMVLV